MSTPRLRRNRPGGSCGSLTEVSTRNFDLHAWGSGPTCGQRAYRGGSFDSDPNEFALGYRNGGLPAERHVRVGFRLAARALTEGDFVVVFGGLMVEVHAPRPRAFDCPGSGS